MGGKRPTRLSRERVEEIRTLNEIAEGFSDGAYLGFMTVEHGIDVDDLSEALPHAEGCPCGECPTFPWEVDHA